MSFNRDHISDGSRKEPHFPANDEPDLTGWYRLIDEKPEARFLPVTRENLVLLVNRAYLLGCRDTITEIMREKNKQDLKRMGYDLTKKD